MSAKRKPKERSDAVIFRRSVAEAVGVTQAILLERLHYNLTNHASKEHDGRLWWSESLPELAADTGMTEKQVRTAADKLIEQGLMFKTHNPFHGWDRTVWWSLDLAGLGERFPDAYSYPSADTAYASAPEGRSIVPKGQMHMPKRQIDLPQRALLRDRETNRETYQTDTVDTAGPLPSQVSEDKPDPNTSAIKERMERLRREKKEEAAKREQNGLSRQLG